MAISRWSMVAALLGMSAACGGVSEERVAALEAQLTALREQQPQAKTDELATFKQEVEKAVVELRAGQQKLEETLEVIGREASAAASRAGGSTQPPPAADVWHVVDSALGLGAAEQIELEDGVFRVRRGWLVEELKLAAAAGKLPKAVADKKAGGVALRGIKPKSLFDQLGLKNNDVVLSVGDKPTPSPAELAAALKQAASPMSVTLKRKNAEVVQTYTLVN